MFEIFHPFKESINWVQNFKVDLQEVGWGMDWIVLAQDRDTCLAVVNAVMNRRVP